MGQQLIVIGSIILVVGLFVTLGGKLGIPRLPGDILIQRDNFTFYFPLTTSILISLVLWFLFGRGK